jgi:type I site-specific restriction-modification system R (restriction) subunit
MLTNKLTVRYARDIPELFKYNAFCVISDGVNNKAGSFFASYEFFYAWRRIAGMNRDVDGIDSMYTLIQGMFHKNRLCDILRSEVYEEMAEQLTNLIWEVHREFSSGIEMGIDFEEKAFYDILKSLCVKYDFTYPEDK